MVLKVREFDKIVQKVSRKFQRFYRILQKFLECSEEISRDFRNFRENYDRFFALSYLAVKVIWQINWHIKKLGFFAYFPDKVIG